MSRFKKDINSQIARFEKNEPLTLDSGQVLAPFQVAYETYGRLNATASNAVLVCHGLTGDQYALGEHPVTKKSGWWETLIGAGKPIDTDRYFVIVSNVIGGCMGSSGPSSLNEDTGKTWGCDFPVLTIHDMVRAQAMLVERLGIEQLFSVIGGSMGGMQVLSWALQYPEKVFSAIPMATTARHSAQNIAFHEVGRQAIMADPDWCGGKYLDEGAFPARGLAVARMAAHITYMSDESLHQKFGRHYQVGSAPTFSFDADFQIESYLRYQGLSFVERFDANSYLYVTRAMDYFDLVSQTNGNLARAFMNTQTRFCVISFTSDWLFPSRDSRFIVRALNGAGANVSYVDIATPYGHDAFLLEVPDLYDAVNGFLDAGARLRNL